MVKNAYPDIRCVGVDLISISSYNNRLEGRKAHIGFLNQKFNKLILLIEDMGLSPLKYSKVELKKIIVSPLRLGCADGSPCTILGYIK